MSAPKKLVNKYNHRGNLFLMLLAKMPAAIPIIIMYKINMQ